MPHECLLHPVIVYILVENALTIWERDTAIKRGGSYLHPNNCRFV
jgi:hypothetical protein